MKIADTYIQYGVPSDWANEFENIGLPSSTFKNTSIKNLIAKYKIEESRAEFVKDCLKRNPIDDGIVQSLLENSRFVCSLCKGQKSDAFIIHHIEPYSVSQDNSYNNLVVLCPNDHDLVHREGQSLTNKITKEQLIKAKTNWQKEVETNNVLIATQNGEISEVDFINIPRVLELYYRLFKQAPKTNYSKDLNSQLLLKNDGSINYKILSKIHKNSMTPFMSFGPQSSWALSLHFEEVFKTILTKINFDDLDSLLNKKSLSNNDLIGKFCFYVGGLYGNRPQMPINEQTKSCHLYFHRKSFFVEWIIDPKYMKSSSSIDRLANRTEYLIYGRIRSVDIKDWKGKDYVYFNIRPYLFGLPTLTKSRRPAIHYDKYKDFEFDEDE